MKIIELEKSSEHEANGVCLIWGKEAVFNIEGDFEDAIIYKIEEKLKWIDQNRDKIIAIFFENESSGLDAFNEEIMEEVAQNGYYELEEGVRIIPQISREELSHSLAVNWIHFEMVNKDIKQYYFYLNPEPDYFGGHSFFVFLNNEDEIIETGMDG